MPLQINENAVEIRTLSHFTIKAFPLLATSANNLFQFCKIPHFYIVQYQNNPSKFKVGRCHLAIGLKIAHFIAKILKTLFSHGAYRFSITYCLSKVWI